MVVTRLGGGSGDKERNLDVLERELIGAADGMDMEVGEREESRMTIRFLARVTGQRWCYLLGRERGENWEAPLWEVREPRILFGE